MESKLKDSFACPPSVTMLDSLGKEVKSTFEREPTGGGRVAPTHCLRQMRGHFRSSVKLNTSQMPREFH